MTLKGRRPERCPDCHRPVRGISTLICAECGALSPNAGYEGLARRRRLQPASPKKRSRYGFRPAAPAPTAPA